MTTPSNFQGTSLSILVYTPVISGGKFLFDLTNDINTYSHSLGADGGFLTASFTIAGDRSFLEDWLQYGLARHVVVYGPSFNVVWEGFVNQIDIIMGEITSVRGPLTNIANRVSVVYTPIIDYGTDPPITGTTTETVIVEDTDSQERYGILEKVVSIGNVLDSEAEYIRDLYLSENAYAEGNTSLAYGSNSGEMSVTIQCLGYVNMLNQYVYNYTTTQISQDADEKITWALSADPNSIISASFIEYSGVIVPSYENENKTAKNVIDSVLALGGGADDRWLFGLTSYRRAYYKAAPTEIEYYYYTADSVQRVESAVGEIIQPWDVKAGKWVALPDFLWGSHMRSLNVRTDPRLFFVEQVDYTAPNTVTLNGSKIRKLAQYMARLGLGGV